MMIEIGRVSADGLFAFEKMVPDGLAALIQGVPDDYIVLGAANDHHPVGILVCTQGADADVCADILLLYAAEGFRRQGIATQLMDALVNGFEAGGPDGIAFRFSQEKPEFLLAHGVVPKPVPGGIGRTTLKAIGTEAFFAAGTRETDAEIFRPLKEAKKKDLAAYFAKQNLRLSAFSPDTFLPESHITLSGGKIVGFAGISGNDKGLEFSWLSSDQDHANLLPGLIKSTFAALRDAYPAETPVTIRAITPASEKLLLRLVPGAEYTPQYEGKASLLRWQIEAEAREAVRHLPEANDIHFI